jgi:HSP20 family molecular chaperone IbpA
MCAKNPGKSSSRSRSPESLKPTSSSPKKEHIPSEKIHYLRLEREFGSFRRLVALPATVLPDRAKAFLQNGVLTLRLIKFVPEEDKETVLVIRKDDE